MPPTRLSSPRSTRPAILVLTATDGDGATTVAWEHVLDPLDAGRTRLMVRSRTSSRWVDLARAEAPAAHHRIPISAPMACSRGFRGRC